MKLLPLGILKTSFRLLSLNRNFENRKLSSYNNFLILIFNL